jgi:CheY-like chemotaxis protein
MTATILIVDDEVNARLNIGGFLTTRGYEVLEASTLAEAREQLRQGRADIVLLDVELPDGYGPSLLGETTHLPTRPPIIIITAFGHIDMAVEAMKNGADLQKPSICVIRSQSCGLRRLLCARIGHLRIAAWNTPPWCANPACSLYSTRLNVRQLPQYPF